MKAKKKTKKESKKRKIPPSAWSARWIPQLTTLTPPWPPPPPSHILYRWNPVPRMVTWEVFLCCSYFDRHWNSVFHTHTGWKHYEWETAECGSFHWHLILGATPKAFNGPLQWAWPSSMNRPTRHVTKPQDIKTANWVSALHCVDPVWAMYWINVWIRKIHPVDSSFLVLG